MGLGSHMAQEDPGRKEKEKRDKQCIPENTAYTSAACCVSSLPGLSPTALSAPLPPRGEPWDSEPA